jgi:hypothetical protein
MEHQLSHLLVGRRHVPHRALHRAVVRALDQGDREDVAAVDHDELRLDLEVRERRLIALELLDHRVGAGHVGRARLVADVAVRDAVLLELVPRLVVDVRGAVQIVLRQVLAGLGCRLRSLGASGAAAARRHRRAALARLVRGALVLLLLAPGRGCEAETDHQRGS